MDVTEINSGIPPLRWTDSLSLLIPSGSCVGPSPHNINSLSVPSWTEPVGERQDGGPNGMFTSQKDGSLVIYWSNDHSIRFLS